MSGHSNQDLQRQIDDNATLVRKLGELTQQLQLTLFANFQTSMGVPLPSAVEADVRQVEYSMVYSTDPITDEFMGGAKTLLDGVFSGDSYASIANKALNVVQVLLKRVVGSAQIQTGGHYESMKILPTGDHPLYVATAFTQVEACSSQEWLTEHNFYLSYYAFAVWSPTQKPVRTLEKMHGINNAAFTMTA
jgi:hypothetical protein